MKKLLLLVTLFTLMGGVNSVKAEKVYGTLNSIFGVDWDSGKNIMKWTQIGDPNNVYTILGTGLEMTDISSYTRFHATLSNFSDNANYVRLRIKDTSGNYADIHLVDGENNVDLLALQSANPSCNFSSLTDITIWGAETPVDEKTIDANNPASVTITDVYLYRPTTVDFDANGEASLGKLEFLASEGLSIDENGVVRTDGTSGKLTITFKDPVDLSALKSFTINQSGDDFIWRTIVKKADGSDVGLWYTSKFGFSFSASQAANATDVKSIIIESNSCPAQGQAGNADETDSEYDARLTTFKAQTLTISNIVMKLYPVATLTYNSSGIATIDLSKISANGTGVSCDPKTHIVTSTGTSGNFVVFLNKADFSHVTTIALDATTTGKVNEGTEDEISLSDIVGTSEVHDAVNNNLNTWYGSKYNMNITSYQSKAGQIMYLKWNINAAGSMKINSITITSDAAMSVSRNNKESLNDVTTYAKWSDVSSSATVAQDADHTWDVGKATGTVYGDPNVNYLYYADLRNYKTMRIYINESSGLVRAMFNRETDNGAYFNVQCNRSDGSLTESNYSSYDNGVFTVNMEKILADKGVVHLNAIKAQAGGSNAYVDKVEVVPVDEETYDYVLSGQYSPNVDITDIATTPAKAIDCSGLYGSNISITSANPNCMFIASNGVLSNSNNVIVSGECAQLALTDGKPFKAPVEFTATAAPTYNRAFTASTTTTVCLPFALTEDEAATLGTFYEFDSVEGSTMNFTSVAAPAANKAYLVETKSEGPSLTLSETDKSIAATPASLATSKSDIEFIGTLAETIIPASDAEYSYYAYNDGSLVKIVSKAATLPAFRGYFKVPTTAVSGARLAARFVNGSITGINEVVNTEVKNEKIADGKYFKNGKFVIFKNGVKYNAAGAQLY